MNCFDCNIPCEYSNPLGYCMLTYCAKKKFEEGAEPADAMKALDEKIKKVSERGTWDGVDVDKYIAALRGRDTEPSKPLPTSSMPWSDTCAKSVCEASWR